MVNIEYQAEILAKKYVEAENWHTHKGCKGIKLDVLKTDKKDILIVQSCVSCGEQIGGIIIPYLSLNFLVDMLNKAIQ